jgi:DNA-binding Lrp family transcriptional regulator
MVAKRELLDLLLSNARESTDDLARQLGTDADEVAALVDELESEGAIRGYHAIVDWDQVDDEHVQAAVELNVELDRETSYDDIANRIAGFSKVSSLHLMSGDYDFAAQVEGESMHDVSRFIADRIAPIPEVTQTVTHFVMERYKEHGVEFDDHDDDRLSVSP